MAITKYKLETKGRDAGYWFLKFGDFKTASGKPKRVRSWHKDDPEFTHYRDRSNVSRPYTESQKDDMLEYETPNINYPCITGRTRP